MAGIGEVAGVVGHALEALFVELRFQGGHFRVGDGGVADEQHDRRYPGRDFGGELADPANDDVRIGFGGLKRVGTGLGVHLALAGEGLVADFANEAGLAAEGLVDGVDGYAGVARDRGDGGGGVAVVEEATAGRVQDGLPGQAGLLLTSAGVCSR